MSWRLRSIPWQPWPSLYSEVIEGIDPGPIEAIRATGANWVQVVRYGVIPQIIPPFTSFTIYRWDINVRSSIVIGMVGGGGIGFYLIQWIQINQIPGRERSLHRHRHRGDHPGLPERQGAGEVGVTMKKAASDSDDPAWHHPGHCDAGVPITGSFRQGHPGRFLAPDNRCPQGARRCCAGLHDPGPDHARLQHHHHRNNFPDPMWVSTQRPRR